MAETSRTSDNLRVVSINSVLGGLASSMTRAVWQPFVLSLGAPMSTLGFLESLGGYRGVVTAPLQYVAGWLSDRLGRKPFMILNSLAGLLAVTLYVVAAITGNWWWLLPGVVLAGAAIAGDPAQQSLVAESVPARQRGWAFSVLMVSWIAPGIFAPAIGGFVADRWGFVPVFVFQLLLYAAGLFLLARYLVETLEPITGRVDLGKLGSAMVRMVVPPRNLRSLYLVLAADSFVWGLGYTLLFGMLSETYGFTTFQLGVMSSLLSITWVLSQLPIGKLTDRHGSKPMMVLSEAMGIPIVAGWLFSSTFLAFALLHACFGVMAATWVPAQNALLANSVPEKQRGEAMGRMAAFKGLVAFPAPFIGGLLYDHFGFQAPVLANLIGVAVVTMLLAYAIREPSREE